MASHNKFSYCVLRIAGGGFGLLDLAPMNVLRALIGRIGFIVPNVVRFAIFTPRCVFWGVYHLSGKSRVKVGL